MRGASIEELVLVIPEGRVIGNHVDLTETGRKRERGVEHEKYHQFRAVTETLRDHLENRDLTQTSHTEHQEKNIEEAKTGTHGRGAFMRREEGFRPALVTEGKENERVDFIQLNMGSDLHQDYQGGCTKTEEEEGQAAEEDPQSYHGVGVCKWFNVRMGFGFLSMNTRDGVPLETPVDVFVHQSKLHMEGFRSLKEGEAVEFTFKKSSKGLESLRVTGPGGAHCLGSERRPKGKSVQKRRAKGD
ncbi:hypothetical protein QQF64_009449, partial [Cirrhinus molitorella]